MLPDVTHLDHYFDLDEHLALRTSLLIFLVLALYRVIDWNGGNADGVSTLDFCTILTASFMEGVWPCTWTSIKDLYQRGQLSVSAQSIKGF
jgi:hypothetical protein